MSDEDKMAGNVEISTRSRLDVMRRAAKSEWVERNQTVAYYENELRKAQIARTHADNDVQYWDSVRTMDEVLRLCRVEESADGRPTPTTAHVGVMRDGVMIYVCAEQHPCPVHGRPLGDSDWRLHPTRGQETSVAGQLSDVAATDVLDVPVVSSQVARAVRDRVRELMHQARSDLEFGDSLVLVCDRATAVALAASGDFDYEDGASFTYLGADVEVNPNVTGAVAYRKTGLMPSTLDADTEEKS